MKKLFTFAALFLAAVGLAIFVFDEYTSLRYGVHITEVAGIDDDGTPILWPTGEDPFFTLFSPVVYALGFWLAGAGVYASRSAVAHSSYRGRVCRGTE